MKKGKNTDYLRISNSLLLLEYYMRGPYCCNDLAKKSGLSNAAVEKICDELHDLGLIKVTELNIKKKVGRAPIYYKLNEDFGIFLAIDLTLSIIEIFDMESNTKMSQKFFHGVTVLGRRYSENDLDNVIKQAEEMLERFDKKKLLAVAVATFGRVNKDTGEFVLISQSFTSQRINLKEKFSYFNVPVIMENDADSSLIAEKEFGALKNQSDCSFYLKIGEGLACVSLINNRVVYGGNGLAGEIGYINVYNPLLKNYCKLSDCVGLFGMSKTYKKITTRDIDPFDIAVEWNKNTDKVLNDVVENSISVLSNTLKNLIDIMDYQIVVIAGEITKFGSRYCDAINAYLRENSHGKTWVRFSQIENETIRGAKRTAINFAVKKFLEDERNKK